MKKLLFILLLVSVKCVAQEPGNIIEKYSWNKNQYGSRMPRFWADSVLNLPQDTAFSKSGIARKGTNLYVGNGSYWSAIVGGSGQVDSFKMMYPLQVYDSAGIDRIRIAYSWQDSALAGGGSGIGTLQQTVDNSVVSSEVYVNNRNNVLTWDSIAPNSFFKNYPYVGVSNSFGFSDEGVVIQGLSPNSKFSSFSLLGGIIQMGATSIDKNTSLYISDTFISMGSRDIIFNKNTNDTGFIYHQFTSTNDSTFNFNGGIQFKSIYPSTSSTDSALVINANGGVGKRAISGGGITKYTTNGYGILVDSTTNLYTISADTNTTAKLRDAKLNTLTDSIAAHNVRIGANTTNIVVNTNNIALKLNSSDSSIYQSKFRSDTARTNTYNTIALKGNGTVTSFATGYGLTGGTITTTGTLIADTATTAKLRDDAINAKLNTTDAATTYYPLTGGSYLSEVNGNGFLGLKSQTTPPTAPTSGLVKLYANSTGRLSWLTSLGFSRTINSRPLTADRTYTFYDRDYTVADSADVTLKANIASPTFTGTPSAPTAPIGTNTTQLATTEYVQANSINSNYLNYYRFFTDFISGYGTLTNSSEMFATSSGTGAGFTMPSEAGRPGIYQANTGTTTTGRHSLNTPVTSTTLGGGVWTYEAIVQIPTLSNGTDRFQTLAGFFDNNTGVNQVDGIYFLYDSAGVSTGSGLTPNWQIVTASNSVRTFTTTSTAVTANQWYRLTIVVNAVASSVSYFINGTSVGTITTNIPSGISRQLGWGFLQNKSLGTNSRIANFDLIFVEGKLTTSR